VFDTLRLADFGTLSGGRALMALKPEAFQRCFQTWLGRLSESGPSDVVDVIAIDGKSLRRSHHHSAGLGPLFLVSAWAVRRGISLGQLATEEKSNEITANPQLLDQIDVSGSVVTIDAAGCQTEIAAKIIDGGGDYVLALKLHCRQTTIAWWNGCWRSTCGYAARLSNWTIRV
jgi:hypothetical protein